MYNNITIIINSCDDYSDVLKLFFTAWHKYNPNCINEIIISSETKAHPFPADTVTYLPKNGIDDWGLRIKQAVNKSKTDYVLITYDDFILEDYFSESGLWNAINILDQDPCAAVVYLVDTKLEIENDRNSDNRQFVKVIDRAPYKLNSSPGLWRKSDFINFTKKGDTPWAWEAFGTYRTQKKSKNFYTLKPGHAPVYPYDNSQGGAIYRGKWVYSFVKKFQEQFKEEIDWTIRGFAPDPAYSRRSLFWKIKFIIKGFRMVGIKTFHFIYTSIKHKINVDK